MPSGWTMTIGPRSQKPLQPVATTWISSWSFLFLSSSSRASLILKDPQETQPVPAQTNK